MANFFIDLQSMIEVFDVEMKKWILHVPHPGTRLYQKVISAIAGLVSGWRSVKPPQP